MSEKNELNLYEEIIINLLHSINAKLYDVSILYKNEGSKYNIYYLTIIAQEELSKLIILPLINEIGDISDFLQNKSKNPFYNHKNKQKIFSTFGVIDKEYERIEIEKQNCLYVGIKEDGSCQYIGEGITIDKCLNEIKLSLLTYEELLNNIIKFGNLSEDANKMVYILIASMTNIFDNIDGIYDVLSTERKNIKKGIGNNKEDIENFIRGKFIRNPYEWICYVKKYLIKEYGDIVYKEHMKKMIKLSRGELIEYLYKIIVKK